MLAQKSRKYSSLWVLSLSQTMALLLHLFTVTIIMMKIISLQQQNKLPLESAEHYTYSVTWARSENLDTRQLQYQ